jgi:5-hydroxyisourate hydrolase-like protein (transthyretin family)
MTRWLGILALTLTSAGSLLAQQPGAPEHTTEPQAQTPTARGQGRGPGTPGAGRRGAPPQRDVAVPTGTAIISGRVVAADTGRPLKRARVVAGGGGRPHAASTDEQGRYRITGLVAGSYTVAVTKAGFVDGAYGQRRISGTGVPVDLTDGQQAANIDVRIARGGVVTGHVLDEEGEPLARAMVTVMRQQYVRGQKQLTSAGADQSDDRGQYRIFGLPPGDYFVSATAGDVEQIVRQLVGDPGSPQQSDASGYAPTYYPGVTTSSDATRLKLAAAQEISGIDFQIQVVALATVKGVVAGGSATVMLISDDGGGAGALAGRGGGRGGFGLFGGGLRAVTRPDGTFAIPNVTPGKYTIVARADGGPNGASRTAVQQVVVAGAEVNVALSPVPNVQLGGTFTLEATGTPPANGFTGFRVMPVAIGGSAAMAIGGRGARPSDLDPAGQFTINDVAPGAYTIRATTPRGWTMKAVYLDGREITDEPIDVKSDNMTGLNVIFTDRVSGLAGSVRDPRGTPASNVTVILFPSDERQWLPQSRRIMTARTDTSGAYQLSAVPPGEYLITAIEDAEQGEWFDPAFLDEIKGRATKIRIEEGAQRTQDLKISPM